MNTTSRVRIAADPQLPESLSFICPYGVYQYVALEGNWSDFEHRVFQEMEFVLDGEMIGDVRAAEFSYSINGTLRNVTVRYDEEAGGYLLSCDAPAGSFQCMN